MQIPTRHRPIPALGLAVALGTLLAVGGCNSNQSSSPPSTPSLPGGMPSSMPSPPGMPGSSSPSLPSPSPSSSPKTKSGPSGSSSPPGGSSGSGDPGSYESLPGGAPPGGGSKPGSSGESEGSQGSDGSSGQLPGQGEPTIQAGWEPPESGGASGEGETSGTPGVPGGGTPGGGGDESWESGTAGGDGKDGWQTSNQVPGRGTSPIPPMPSERDKPAGGGADGELDGALEDFDGEILSERAVIRKRSNETAGASTGSLPQSGGTESADGSGTADMPPRPGGPIGIPSSRSQPPAPRPAGSNVPDDIPDARDDDIIARQLREAAVAETDPELKEKLWDEYRRYKGI